MNSILLFCNCCGTQFTTIDPWRRFCSRSCTDRFRGLQWRAGMVRSLGRTQAAILNVLRAAGGEWVPLSDILLSIYGDATLPEYRAFTISLYRLRAAWASSGLVIGCHMERARFDRDNATAYRLEHDIVQEMAS